MAIRYDGYVVPCCHFGGPAFKQLKRIVGDKLQQMHVTSGTLDEINKSEAYKIIEDSFETNPAEHCIKMCGKEEYMDLNKTLANSKYTQSNLN